MSRPRRHAPSGFTLIELIVVIAVLSILAATALPKFLDVNTSAKSSALKAVVSSAGSAMAINYGSCVALSHVATASRCIKISNCSDLPTLLQGGAMPTGYTIAATALGTGAAGSNGVEDKCTITQTDGGATSTFLGVSAGNG